MTSRTNNSHVFYRKFKHPHPTISHGEGIYLWDTDGKRYIDASGGAVVVNVGHGIKAIAGAMGEQAASVAFAHATMFTSDVLEQLANELAEVTPIPDARLFFMCSGSEANETAMKFARQLQIARGETLRHMTISRWGSYHGGTLGAVALTGKASMRRFFTPMFVDVPHIPPPYCYRCSFNLTYPECGIACAQALEDEILRHGKENVSAFIAEPVSGATIGAVVPPPEYWPTVREICDLYGVLLIADEVMSGMGRTGRWFAIEHWKTIPDILCMGKGVSGGYAPLSVTAVRGDLVELLWGQTGDFNHGGTYSHQPVTAAAGLAALQYIKENDLITHAARVGERLGERLREELGEMSCVGDVRGLGMIWALEFVADRKGKTPFSKARGFAGRVFETAFKSGLIVYAMPGCADGESGDHVMVAPPLVVEESQIDDIIGLLRAAIELALVE
jgi:adenosylmethionine-8-amino-7-oxononanoate aminotransferase